MKPKRVVAVYISAVGHTKMVTEQIAADLAAGFGVPWGSVDLTRAGEVRRLGCESADERGVPTGTVGAENFPDNSLVVVGVPTYAGRVPNKILPRLRQMLRGRGTPVVPVVTFGNRSSDSALPELVQMLEAQGFVTIGAGAFPCEHVFSEKIGTGRPDAADWDVIRGFSEALVKKIQIGGSYGAGDVTGEANKIPNEEIRQFGCAAKIEGLQALRNAEIAPYYTPLGLDGQPVKFLKAKPVTDPARCEGCGRCARVCPMNAIDLADVTQVPGTCIKCHACIRKCPQDAKQFVDEAFLSHVAMLEASYTHRAGAALFF